MTGNVAYHVGFYSHAWGLARRFVHLHWSAQRRAAWSLGYRDSSKAGAWGRYAGLVDKSAIPGYVTDALRVADDKFRVDPL